MSAVGGRFEVGSSPPRLEDARFLAGEGRYLDDLDDAAAARPYAERALELSPQDAAALALAGWVDFKAGIRIFKLGNYAIRGSSIKIGVWD